MSGYVRHVKHTEEMLLPRLPLEGSIDLTYRCNNHCLHCWLWLPEKSPIEKEELSFEEIRRIVDEARMLGCRSWKISGGEPMLREDFSEIFDYITIRAVGYTLNTNGTLITPKIAQQLKRKGSKMIALYGATAEVYDAITRHPGGFEQLMQSFSYLKEAGAGFIIQLIPLKANWHQWEQMNSLAESISPHHRIGAPWLYLSADGSEMRNREIAAQRLNPEQVIELDKPYPDYSESVSTVGNEAKSTSFVAPTLYTDSYAAPEKTDDLLFASCIATRRGFHLDPYGQMSWCSFIKDSALRYNLRHGTIQEGWESFIPGCADKVHGGIEWQENCGNCDKRNDCRWCAVYSYLESGCYSAPIDYLCRVADEAGRFKEKWLSKHCRYFKIAGITAHIESDLDFDTTYFQKKLQPFGTGGPGDDNIYIRHYFELPDLDGRDLGTEISCKSPLVVSRKKDNYIYRYIYNSYGEQILRSIAFFNLNHRRGTIYHLPCYREQILEHGWHSLSLFPDDNFWLNPILADHRALSLNSVAAMINGKGIILIDLADMRDSILKYLLEAKPENKNLTLEILGDQSNIVRKWNDGWHLHGTWDQTNPDFFSPVDVPLRALFILRQAETHQITPISDPELIREQLLSFRPGTAIASGWGEKETEILEQLIAELPFFTIYIDRSGSSALELYADIIKSNFLY